MFIAMSQTLGSSAGNSVGSEQVCSANMGTRNVYQTAAQGPDYKLLISTLKEMSKELGKNIE